MIPPPDVTCVCALTLPMLPTGAMKSAGRVCDQLKGWGENMSRASVVLICWMSMLLNQWLLICGCSTRVDLAVESTKMVEVST